MSPKKYYCAQSLLKRDPHPLWDSSAPGEQYRWVGYTTHLHKEGTDSLSLIFRPEDNTQNCFRQDTVYLRKGWVLCMVLRSPKVANIIESSSVCLASSWRLCMMVGHVRWVRGSPAINIPWKTLKLHHARPDRRWWWRGWGCSWS